jgi:hypothetical protein
VRKRTHTISVDGAARGALLLPERLLWLFACTTTGTMTMDRGDHACVIYSAGPELIAVVAAYLHEGLLARERCWYAASSPSEASELKIALQAKDVAVAAEEERGALRLFTGEEVYLADGTFQPERVLLHLEDAINVALHDGFTALRVGGEMSWALEPKPGTDRVIDYEGRVELLLRGSDALGLCMYHRRRMPAALLDGVLASHALAGVGGPPRPNAFYRPKPISDLRTPQTDDISWKLKHLERSRA